MQYGDIPLFILLLAAIYLTAIYGILKVAEKLSQKENSSKLANSNGTENNVAYINYNNQTFSAQLSEASRCEAFIKFRLKFD